MRIRIDKTKLFFIFMFAFLVLSFLGPAYSWFSYDKELALNLGTMDISNTVSGTTSINITNLKSERISKARSESDNYIDFTLTSKNNYQSTNMYYYIKLNYGNDITGKTRIADNLLVFDLEKTVSGTTTKVIDSDIIPNINGLIIYKDTLAPQTNNKVINFRLRIWVKEGETDLTNKYANFNIEVVPVYFDPTVNAYISNYDENLTFYEQMLNNSIMDNVPSEFVTASTGVNFANSSSDSNGKGLYMRAGTENDEFPIVYYRGAVNNNNMLFADFCWKIVRTTEKGGIKLIYNGTTIDGKCTNTTGTDTQIGTSEFNASINSPAYSGYMYGIVYTRTSGSMTSGSTTGTSFTWDGTNYTLTNTSTTLDSTHHYTCNNTTGICTELRYYYYSNESSTFFYIKLTNGKSIEDTIEEMQTNTNNSIIKIYIDNWYQTNMTSYTNLLEDSIYCNDRTMQDNTNGWVSNGGSLTTNLFYGAYGRKNVGTPTLTCNINDSFTVSDITNGNGALTYPVALITADEVILAGGKANSSNEYYYLHTNQDYYALSAGGFAYLGALGFFVSAAGGLDNCLVYQSVVGVRPVVTINPDEVTITGSGTAADPYIAMERL